MSKLRNIVKNNVIKKIDYNSKITEIENLATKTELNTVENKIPDASGLVKKNYYNAKITETEDKSPDVTNLGKKTALNTVKKILVTIIILITLLK